MSKRSIRKKRHLNIPKKPSKAKKFMTGLTIMIALALTAATICTGADLYLKKTRCTAETTGNVTNVRTKRYHRRNRTRTRSEADVVVQTDGVFPSRTIHTNNQLYTRMESLTVYYDPEDTDLYYLENDLREELTLTLIFAVLSAGEIAISVLCIRVIRRGSSGKRR